MNFLSKISTHKKAIFFVFLCFFICSSLLFVSRANSQPLTPAEEADFNTIMAGGTTSGGMTPEDQAIANQVDADVKALTDQSNAAIGEVNAVADSLDKACLFSTKDKWCCYKPVSKNSAGKTEMTPCITDQEVDSVGSIDYGAGDFIYAVSTGISRLVLWGAFLIAGYCSYILDWVLLKLLSAPITSDARFAVPWSDVRNLANMIIVLGFVVVGIATALRIRAYAAGQLLWKLILIALVVNFSGLFCGLIIDAANLTTSGILSSQNGNMGEIVLFKMMPAFKGTNVGGPKASAAITAKAGALTWYTAKWFPWKFAGNCIIFSVVYLGTAFTFLYLAAVLIARYIILIILFILSPLAFAFWVFPASQKYWSEWWGAFLKWAFIGIFGSFVLWLSLSFINAIDTSTLSSTVITCVEVLVILYVGFKMTSKNGGVAFAAAGAVMGLAVGGAKLAMGGVGKVAGYAANRTGASRVGNWAKTKALRAAEAMRWIPPGSAKLSERKAVDEAKKGGISTLNGQETAKALNKPMVYTQTGVRRRAALAERAIEQGTFDPTNDRHVAGLKDAQARGFALTSEHINKDPRLAKFDNAKMTELTNPIKKGGKGLKQADAEVEATKQVVEGMTPKEFRGKVGSGALGDINVLKHANKDQIDEVIAHGSKKKRTTLKDFGNGGSKEALWNAHGTSLGAGPRTNEWTAMKNAINLIP